MGRRAAVAVYVLALVVVVVCVDVLFFRHHIWERLFANVGIVALFAAVYLWKSRNARQRRRRV